MIIHVRSFLPQENGGGRVPSVDECQLPEEIADGA